MLLKYLGTEGNGAPSLALGNFFGIGTGAVINFRDAALEALLTLESRTHSWPTKQERKAISSRIKDEHFFPNCVGLIDGTLLPLAFRPLLHGENYMSRKKVYAIVMLIVCDDQNRILYYHVGWPGSVHDNRVWRNCKLFTKCHEYFSKRQYLLGDSAFTASAIMVPPFKTLPGAELLGNKLAFNTLLAKPRVKSEHCIGTLKGRFPFPRRIRLKIGNRHHMAHFIKCIRGAVVLHNFLIGEPVEEDWMDNNEEGDDDLQPETPDRPSNAPDYSRRDDVLYHFSELEDVPIN